MVLLDYFPAPISYYFELSETEQEGVFTLTFKGIEKEEVDLCDVSLFIPDIIKGRINLFKSTDCVFCLSFYHKHNDLKFQEDCHIEWLLTLTDSQFHKIRSPKAIATVYVGVDPAHIKDENDYQDARKNILEKHRKNEIEKRALLDLIEEGVIFSEEDPDLHYLRLLKKKYNLKI